MAGAAGGFFAGLLGGVGDAFAQKREEKVKQEHEQNLLNAQVEMEGRKALTKTLLDRVNQDPTRETATEAFRQLGTLQAGWFAGEKGKGGKGAKGAGGLAGLMTPENLSQLYEGLASTFPTKAEYDQQQEAEARQKLELDVEKYERTTGTKSPSERSYNPLSEIVDRTVKEREADGHKVGADEYRQIVLEAQQGLTGAKAKPPNATVVDRQRVTRAQRLKLINPNLTDDQADVMAARLIEGENKQKLDASLAKSYDVIARDKETLALLKETAPLTVLAKQLGIETAEDRLDNKKAAGSKDPAAILQAARKYAHKVAADTEKNRSLFSKIFGDTPPTEDELTDKFIAEWTNENPEDVRTQAAAVRKPTAPPKSKPASAGLTNPFK